MYEDTHDAKDADDMTAIVRKPTECESNMGVMAVIYPVEGDEQFTLVVYRGCIDFVGGAYLTIAQAEAIAQALLVACKICSKH